MGKREKHATPERSSRLTRRVWSAIARLANLAPTITRARIVAMAFLLALSCGLTYYFHAILRTEILFTHFFYVPIVLACIWWRRRGLVVSAFLAALLIASRYTFAPPGSTAEDYGRAAMFLVISFVVVVLCERIAQWERMLEWKVKSRTKELKETSDYLTNLIRYANTPIVVWDPDRKITIFNKAFEKMSGKGEAEVLGRPLEVLFPKESCSESLVKIEISREQYWENVEIPILHNDGRIREALWNSANIYAEDGKTLIATIAQGQDITERKRAEGKVKHLNAVLRAIRSVNQLILREKDRDRLLQGACDNLIETRGYYSAWIALLDEGGRPVTTAEAGLGARSSPMTERLGHGKLPRCAGEALKQSGVVAITDPASECTGCPLSGEHAGKSGMAIRLKYGEVVHGILSVSIPAELAEDAEEQSLLIEIAEDIAFALHDIELIRQHELAEEALRESEEQYRAIFESATDAVLIFDLDGTIVEANPAAYAVYGYSHEEMIGLNGKDIVHPERYHLFEDFKEQVKTTGRFFAESVDMRKDGSAFDVEVRGTTFTFKGKPHLLAAVRDITERKRAEQERQKLEEQLRHSQKMEAIGRLAGGVAHDFRNQLTVIKGFTEMLLRQSLVAEEGRDKIAEVLKAVERSTKLTSQLLAFSRKERLEPQVVDLSDLVADLSESLPHMIGEDIRLSVRSGSRPCCANVDPNLLQQAIMNMVVNARDAMPNGGGLVFETDVVDLNAESVRRHPGTKPGQYAVFSIEDAGIGMDEATQERIFEPFFTTKQVGEGTGLGLSMVYGFVKQSGGSIECKSEPGKGARFSVYLPKVDQTATEAETVAEPSQELPRGSETILVVEDEEPVRRMLVESLREGGYRVLEAANSVEALPLGEHYEDRIDLLVTDVIMPQMSGSELAKRLRSVRPNMAVLFISGYSGVVAQSDLLEPGIEMLAKPFDYMILARTVRRLLDRANPMPQKDE